MYFAYVQEAVKLEIQIPLKMRNTDTCLTVEYRANFSAGDSGFDAFLNLSFDPSSCIGYPVIHAYFDNMKLTGYKRFCGFIQIVERQEFVNNSNKSLNKLFLDAPEDMIKAGIPYFSYGYPAELYDAPCNNLNNNDKLLWRAYTYLVDMPSRMNNNKLSFLSGFSWGYIEDKTGPIAMLDFKLLSESVWDRHYSFLRFQCPDISK
jgi:hypothetical protein